jgi:preprotein translocase subunit SecE
MKKIINYFKEAYNELVHKVSWPTWGELQSSAIVVMVASVVIALMVFVMDISFQKILEFIYDLTGVSGKNA